MIFSAATCVAMLLSLSACGQDGDSPTPKPTGTSSSTPLSEPGTASVFLPSDGITLSQNTPLNKWTKLEKAIVDALVDQGLDNNDVSTVSSKSLDDQADAITKHLEERTERNARRQSDNGKGSTGNTPHETMIIAPVSSPDDVTRQYGDYVSQTLSRETTGNESPSTSPASPSANAANDDASQNNGVTRLVSALEQARKDGVSVILVANGIEGYKPDAFVRLSTLSSIARTQATLLASKLDLSQTTSENPKHVEIMLPANDDDAMTKEVFASIWEVLGPYYRSGVVVSPSGLLDSHSDANSWNRVTFKATDAHAVGTELSNRLGLDGKDGLPAIDGVLAMNDFVASGVVSTLSSAGYQGSAADINPQITIGGIMDNIVGNKDLKKHQVPDPRKSSASVSGEATDADGDSATDAWPIITGYGAYLSNITDVVDGAQWSTGLEDRNGYAKSIAETAVLLNAGKTLTAKDVDGTATINGDTVPLIEKTPISVSANNLKKALIDPGYIKPADAGL
ncbi:substrate-binding domain-containing protein [Bifidobacterium margollesii]|nr:substrate-binding domain-containing protein [Bifidobacterium margollesii]